MAGAAGTVVVVVPADDTGTVVGGVVAIMTVTAGNAVEGPGADDASTTEYAARETSTVPSDWHTTVTFTEGEAVDEDGARTHPDAVPVSWKSPAAIPDTDSLNDNAYNRVRPDAGDDGLDQVAEGIVPS